MEQDYKPLQKMIMSGIMVLSRSFRKKTGVPILLNTSFNDREPIVETPRTRINCFLRTNIDYLYFREHGILVRKNG